MANSIVLAEVRNSAIRKDIRMHSHPNGGSGSAQANADSRTALLLTIATNRTTSVSVLRAFAGG